MDRNNASFATEKGDIAEVENGHSATQHGDSKRFGELERGDRTPTAMTSFAHLDEKRILRKVGHFCLPHIKYRLLTRIKMDVRLIPMLAILYLLSFLDR